MGGQPVGVARALVVVDNFDIGGSFLCPDKTDAPLVIDPDGVLATTITGQRFEPSTARFADKLRCQFFSADFFENRQISLG
jgi:hypothetical protein